MSDIAEQEILKINIIIPFFLRTGGIKLILEYANRLTLKGHNVIVYSPIYPYNYHAGQFNIVANIKRFYRRIRELALTRKTLRKFKVLNIKIKFVPVVKNIFVRNADIAMATSWPTAYSVNKLNNRKKFYFIQDYENWDSFNINMADNSYLLPLIRITTCEYLHKLIFDKFKVESTIIFNGIDPKMFYNDNKIFSKPNTLLFIDNGLKRKNCIQAVETSIKLKKHFPDLNIISFGHKQYHDMPEYIKFTEAPDDDEIRKLYSKADIFLFTSKEEGFATPPAEAMACKCAVVTSRIAAVEEYSKHMESAIHVDPNDPDEYFRAVSYLLDNPDECKRISLNAYAESQKILDCWDESTDKLEALFKEHLK